MLIISFILIIIILIVFILNIRFVPSLRSYRLLGKLRKYKGFPLIGSGLTIISLKNDELLDFMVNNVEEYGPLGVIWLVGVPVVVLLDPEDIKEVFGNINNMEKGIEYNPLRPWLLEGLLLSSGKKWHTRRKLLTPAFHFKMLEASLSIMQKHAQHLVKKMSKSIDEPINIHEYFTLCSLDIICDSAMGIDLGAQDNPTTDYIESLKRLQEITVRRAKNFLLQSKLLSYITPEGWEYERLLKKLHAFTEKIIQERKLQHLARNNVNMNGTNENKDEPTKKHKAFLDILLEMDGDNKLSDLDIREEVDTFLFEGHDTTSSGLLFTSYLLALHQDVQTKVINELDEILQDDTQPITMKNLNDMKYLEKVIKETLRLYPSVPYISRKITKEITLDGDKVIPYGTNITIIPYVIHRRPELFPEPEKFDPERFSIENCDSRHPYSYLPFSAGPKNCIGQKLAMMELKIVISTILKSYRLETITKLESIKCVPLMILRTNHPVFIKLIPRKHVAN